MATLSESHCVPPREGEPTVSEVELAELMPQIPEWTLTEEAGEKRLKRSFSFPNFAQAMEFADQVGRIAEQEDHHPRLTIEWGKVTVEWWTHKIGGLHRNDFIMAAKTGELYS